jgi:hypothetical protein
MYPFQLSRHLCNVRRVTNRQYERASCSDRCLRENKSKICSNFILSNILHVRDQDAGGRESMRLWVVSPIISRT